MDIFSYLLGKKSSGGGSGGATTDWSQIGYTNEPTSMQISIDYAKTIANNWDSSTTTMYNLYSNNKELFFFPIVDTSNVSNMQGAFLSSNLLEVPMIDTSNTTTMQNSFQNTLIREFPLLNTSNVVNMTNVCRDCKILKTIKNIDTSQVKNFDTAFNGCSLLENVPILDTKNVLNNGLWAMFSNCTQLTNDSLNNIMKMCINAKNGNYSTKTLSHLGISSDQATICQTLSNYDDFIAAGWTTGY